MPRRKEHKVINGEELKHCKGCDKWLELGHYCKNKQTADGYNYLCKTCGKDKRTGPYYAGVNAYRLLLDRVNNRRGEHPRYQEKGIKCLITKEDFIAWFVPRYFKGCLVDRIDNDGHYELSNMQLISREEHNYKMRNDNLAKYGVVEPEGMRYCYECKVVKPIDEFGAKLRKITKINPQGLDEHCKACRRKERNDYYRRLKCPSTDTK